jgi:polysaccharide biosynthesis protein PelD
MVSILGKKPPPIDLPPEAVLAINLAAEEAEGEQIGDDDPSADFTSDEEQPASSRRDLTPDAPREEEGSEESAQEETEMDAEERETKGLSARILDRGIDRGFRWSSIVETLLFTTAILIINHLLHPQDPGYLSVQPHPFWIVVLLISIRYVFRESLLCAVIVAVAYISFVVFPGQTAYRFSAITLFADFKEPLLFLIVAGFLSSYTQHLLERTQVLRGQVIARNEDIADLRDRNLAAGQALRRLEGRIASEYTSILDLFAELAGTKQMSADQIKEQLLDILVRYLNVEEATYYDIERGQLVRRFSTIEGSAEAEAGAQDFLLTQALGTEEVVHLGQFSQQDDLERYQGLCLMAGALRNASGDPIGLISVEAIPFIDYNPHTFKLLGTVVEWWGTILEEAMRLKVLRSQSAFDEELGVFNYTYFANRVAQEFERTRRFSLPMSLVLLRIDGIDEIFPQKLGQLRYGLATIINQVISELEMVAIYKSDDLLAISFPIAMAEDAEKRVLEIISQIEAFAFRPYGDPQKPLSLSWAIADYEIGMESHEELIAKVEAQLAGDPPPSAESMPESDVLEEATDD